MISPQDNILNKIYINSQESYSMGNFQIQQYLQKNKEFKGLILTDKFGKIHFQSDKFIPQIFNGYDVYISADSFQQNHSKLSIKIRKFVSFLINYKLNLDNLLCIGGESYLYGLTSNKQIIHWTNSKSIFDDCNFNMKFYNSSVENNLVDYNKINFNNYYKQALINLSHLNENLIIKLNYSMISKIIIINCNEKDFWKKIKKLSNYKIISREYFICEKLGYFITVNLLELK